MAHVRLIHWNAAQAGERAAALRAAGYRVEFEPFDAAALRALRTTPPAAVIIDLSRLPAQGRDVGVALRHAKATRHIPLVFVEGDPSKVARITQHLPDAVYTTWSQIRSRLKEAIANPLTDPIAPPSVFAGYAGTPLVKKLGIKANAAVYLVGAPQGFEQKLAGLPTGARLRRRARGSSDLIIWFIRSRTDMEARLPRVLPRIGKDGLWIAWPKRASGIATDLTQAVVRQIGLAAGLVDYKIAAIDAQWSGLKFTRRKAKIPS